VQELSAVTRRPAVTKAGRFKFQPPAKKRDLPSALQRENGAVVAQRRVGGEPRCRPQPQQAAQQVELVNVGLWKLRRKLLPVVNIRPRRNAQSGAVLLQGLACRKTGRVVSKTAQTRTAEHTPAPVSRKMTSSCDSLRSSISTTCAVSS
jgi:hypothetical protein